MASAGWAKMSPRVPELVDAREAAVRLRPGDHPGITLDARYPREHPVRRRRQRHPPRPGLGIAEPQLAGRPVEVVPPERQDLVPAAPGEQQEADRRHHHGHARPLGLGFEQHPAEPRIFIRAQEPLAPALPVALHRPARVGPRRGHAPGHRQLEHLRDHAQRLVRLARSVPQLVVQRRDMRPVDLGQLQPTQLRQDVQLEQAPEGLHRPRPAVHRDMRRHVALREIGHRRLLHGRRRHRVLAAPDPVDDLRRLAPRLLRGHLDIPADDSALRQPARYARLGDVDFAPGRVDPYPESRLVAVPEHLVAAFDGKGVYGSLAELDGAHGRISGLDSLAVTLPNPSSIRKRPNVKLASLTVPARPHLRRLCGVNENKVLIFTVCYGSLDPARSQLILIVILRHTGQN